MLFCMCLLRCAALASARRRCGAACTLDECCHQVYGATFLCMLCTVAEVACLACLLPWKAALAAGCLAGITGAAPQASLRANSSAESSAQWCRGFFYRITVIMGQEAIMRLTDARGYVVGTSQVSNCSFVGGVGPISTCACWHPCHSCRVCDSWVLLKPTWL